MTYFRKRSRQRRTNSAAGRYVCNGCHPYSERRDSDKSADHRSGQSRGRNGEGWVGLGLHHEWEVVGAAFSTLSDERKLSMLRELAAMIQQAHASESDVPEAVAKSGLKPTHTPAVLMGRGPVKIQASKVIGLPEQEREKAFLLFVALLGIADVRRRHTECASGCTHWWHRDLSDDLQVERILRQGQSAN